MPPSRHSSSSHSSRSHSSSHRSSSHSSSHSYSRSSSYRSGSRSYSGSSGPSRHSGSSHSSSYSGSSGSIGTRRAKTTSQIHTLRRTRSRQPLGWKYDTHGAPMLFALQNHDYIYYPHSWTDETGASHEEGYYDENGTLYENMVAPGVETVLHCRACGAHRLFTWTNGTIPTCDSCGAAYEISIRDELPDTPAEEPSPTGMKKPENRIALVLALIFVVICMGFVGFIYKAIRATSSADRSSSGNTDSYVSTQAIQNPIHVDVIDRTCYLDGENYYDTVSDCWFWYNTEVSPGQWQYWYEGISSDYGDYGWMEYDDAQGQWYIEVSDGQWVELPARYDTSGLWHFDDAYINPYN